MTSCMFTSSSLPRTLHRVARAASSGVQENSRRNSVGVDLSLGLDHVRQRDRLAAVLLADRLVVGEVDSDRRDRAAVAGLDHDLDRVGGDPADVGLAIARVPGHVVLEPLRLGRELLDAPGLRGVDVGDDGFPRALDAARVHVDLDEPVDGIDRRVLVADPGDVVRLAVGDGAGLVERDQGLERLAARLGGDLRRGLQVADDPADLGAVLAVGPVDLLDQLVRPRLTSREFSG